MKFTANLALALTIVVLLAVGAVGFADKTQELAAGKNPPIQGEQHKMDGGGTMDGPEHGQTDDVQPDGMEGMNH